MTLKEFIETYTNECHRGFCQYVFYGEMDNSRGVFLPENFVLENDISKLPFVVVAVNKEEKAIIDLHDKEITLSIFDHIVQMEAALEEYRESYRELFRCNYL